MSQSRYAIVVALLLATLVLTDSTPVAHADQEPGWRLRLTAAAIQPVVSSDYDLDAGFGLGIGYRFSRRLSVDLDATHATISSSIVAEAHIFGDYSITIQTELDATPVLARLNVHLTPDRKLDLHAGVTAGWMRTGDLVTTVGGETINPTPPFSMDTRDSFAWGAHVGLDRPVGDRGAFLTGRLTYLESDIELDGGFDLALDPVMLNLGIGYRF